MVREESRIMHRWSSIALIVSIIGVGGLHTPRALAQETVTIQGEVVDMACYMAHEKKGPSHKSCALLCAKGGVPMGILTDSGEVYLLIDNHDDNTPYEAVKKLAGSRAELTGQKFVKQGVASIMVSAVKGL
jgi:hypothetical protein